MGQSAPNAENGHLWEGDMTGGFNSVCDIFIFQLGRGAWVLPMFFVMLLCVSKITTMRGFNVLERPLQVSSVNLCLNI